MWEDSDGEEDEDGVEDKVVEVPFGFQKLGPACSCQKELPDDWVSTPNMIRETGRKAIAMSSRTKVHKEISVYKERG